MSTAAHSRSSLRWFGRGVTTVHFAAHRVLWLHTPSSGRRKSAASDLWTASCRRAPIARL